MYSLGCPPRSQLGLALPAIIPGALAQLGPIGSLFGGSDPAKDQERREKVDVLFNQAMAGDLNAEAALRCKAGQVTQRAIDLGLLDSAGGCDLAGGSDIGKAYAKTKLAELEARRAAGVVGTTLIGQSNIPTTVVGTLGRTFSNPWVIGGAFVAGYFLLRRRR